MSRGRKCQILGLKLTLLFNFYFLKPILLKGKGNPSALYASIFFKSKHLLPYLLYDLKSEGKVPFGLTIFINYRMLRLQGASK